MTDAPALKLTLAHAEAAFLATYLRVLSEWDLRACVRLLSRGSNLGVFGAPPTGCLSFVALPLVIAPVVQLDTTVIAGRFRDLIGDVSTPQVGPREVRVPEPVSMPFDLIALPPSSGWELDQAALAADVLPTIDAALAEFKRRIPPEDSVNSDQSQRVAQEIWSRPGLGKVPLRALHTAKSLGMLNKSDVSIQSATTNGWTRLATPAGQVFATDESSNLGMRLSLLN